MVLTTGKEISVPKSRYPEVKRQYTLFKGAEREGYTVGDKRDETFLRAGSYFMTKKPP